jgi:hypothetical protein
VCLREGDVVIFTRSREINSVQFGKPSSRSGPRRWLIIEIPLGRLKKKGKTA